MFIKLVFSLISIRLVNVALMASITFLLAKTLDQEEFGTYTLLLSYVAICIMPIQAGLPILSIRIISGNKNRAIPKELLMFSFFSVVGYLIILFMIDNILIFFDYNLISGFRFEFYFLCIVTLTLSILNGYMQGLNLVIKSQILEQLLRPLLFVFFIITLYFLSKELSKNTL